MKSTLYLISCSDRKQAGGGAWHRAMSVADLLPVDLRHRLLCARREVLHLIKSGELRDQQLRGFRSLSPTNSAIVEGPDFGADLCTGLYLPAWRRYSHPESRFYGAVAGDVPEATLERLWSGSWQPSTRTLIVSGLYGVLVPHELIQDYDCHLGDIRRSSYPTSSLLQYWQPLLTEVVRSIAEAQGATRIVDLLSERTYQSVINWDSVAQRGLGVRHRCFKRCDWQDALPNLGRYFRHEILNPSSGLSGPSHGTSYFSPPDEIVFEKRLDATEGVSREGPRRWYADLERLFGPLWHQLDVDTRDDLAAAEYVRDCLPVWYDDLTGAGFPLFRSLERWLNTTLVVRAFETDTHDEKWDKGSRQTLGTILWWLKNLKPESRGRFSDALEGVWPALKERLEPVVDARNDVAHEQPLSRRIFDDSREHVHALLKLTAIFAQDPSSAGDRGKSKPKGGTGKRQPS